MNGTPDETRRTVVDRVRQPEYTGENRCLPCTVVNIAIAAVGSAALATVSLPFGVAAFVASAVVIYLRGYLVPGTPTLTKRYLPERVLALFGKEAGTRYGVGGTPTASTDGTVDASSLETAGVATFDTAGTGRLTDEFRTALDEEFDRLGDPPTEASAAAAFGVETDDVSVVAGTPAATVGDQLVHWESTTAQSLDVAAGRLLADRFDDWETLSPRTQSQALASVRALLTDCPDCGGAVNATTETPKTCCRDPAPVLFLTCTDCDARLLERAVDELDAVVETVERVPAGPPAAD